MAFPLTEAKIQIADANGKPLAGGLVYTYVPGTFTSQTTWQDIGGTITNPNPVPLDSAGRALIFATGSVRMIVNDSLGNQIEDAVTQVPSLSNLGAVAKAGDTMTGNLTVPGLVNTAAQNITVNPTTEPSIAAKTSLNVQGTTQSTTNPEFLVTLGLTANKRAGLSAAVQDSVTLFSSLDAVAGCGDCWSLNTVLTMEANSSVGQNYQGYELDFNNLQGNKGETPLGAGLAAPVAYALSLAGVGGFRSTAAQLIVGPGTNTVWNRGIVCALNSIQQTAFQDLTNSITSFEVAGSHTYGFDSLTAAFSSAAIRVGNGQFIRARNAGNSADSALLVQSGAILYLGDATSTSIATQTNLIPNGDNTLLLGQNGNRWSAVWAANGTIQTSDPSLKTNIKPLSSIDTGAILDAVEPITFQWKVGGFTTEAASEEQDVQATETVMVDEHSVAMVNGVAVQTTAKVPHERPLFDVHPVVDAAGNPVMVFAGKALGYVQQTHSVPRMVKKTVATTKQVEKPGARTHWGFNAEDLGKIAGIAGVDYGGFVKAEDGTLHRRSDQENAILWEEVRRLRARVATLEAKR